VSPKQTLDETLPIACERCGHKAAIAFSTDERVADAPQMIRCAKCGFGWFAPEQNTPFTLRRKLDRRARLREE